ncbi:CHAP domain-containing protein [Staphylococcus epidermidis]|nr:CHAP domain-containing protein [Staphylococcus epidermidis]
MKKTLTVTLSSIAAFIAINTAANAQESETSQLDTYATGDVITNQSNLGIYIVKPGDSLYKIALEHNLSLEELYALNPGVEPLIFPGDEIVVSETAFEQFNNTNTFVNYETNYIPVGYNNVSTDTSNTTYDNYDSESTDTYSVSNAYDGLRSVSNSGNLYTTGQCTYYAFDRRAELGKPIGSLWGNASNWAYSANQAGFNVDHTPEVGAVFQSGPGQNGAGAYGHVGVVESINSNGSVTVSEMNWNVGVNVKSYRTISNPNSYNYIH